MAGSCELMMPVTVEGDHLAGVVVLTHLRHLHHCIHLITNRGAVACRVAVNIEGKTYLLSSEL